MKRYFIKICVLFVLVITVNLTARGQSNTIEAQYKFGQIALSKSLSKKFGQETKKYGLNVCLISAVFAKFTIDTNGNVKSISFSGDKETPAVLKKILASVILSTNGAWIPRTIDGKPTESRPFILPLIYAMEAGCNPQDVQLNNAYKPVANGLETSLLYILNFDDGTGNDVAQLDCILLEPLHIFSQN